jgi:Tol biopolymer transport system component
MSYFKWLLTAALISISTFSVIFTGSCTGPSAYKPSGLPSLIAYSSDRDQTVHIYTVNPDGTGETSTSTNKQILDGLPMWTPDGKRILFSSTQSTDFEIWSMNPDGGDRQKLTDRKEWDGLARMSPDGSRIVYATEHAFGGEDKSMSIYIMNSDGSGPMQLTALGTGADNAAGTTSANTQKPWNSVPTWSPDGSKILFATNREGNGVSPVLYTMNPDGSNQNKFGFIFSVEGTEPDWSPVNNKIIYVKGSQAKGDIWIMDAVSPFPSLTAKKLTDNIDNNRSPIWSPDGTQIAFISDTYGNDDVFIMNADGTNVRRLTYDKGNERHPTWR